MGIFDSLVEAFGAANEAAHADRLKREFDDSVRRMASLDRSLTDEAISRFVKKRRLLSVEMPNWSRDGQLNMANALRRKAREVFDTNMIEGFALWMSSAWLESRIRNHPAAQGVFLQLDGLASGHDALEATASVVHTEAENMARAQRIIACAKDIEVKRASAKLEQEEQAERREKANRLIESVENRLHNGPQTAVDGTFSEPRSALLYGLLQAMKILLDRNESGGFVTEGRKAIDSFSILAPTAIGMAIAIGKEYRVGIPDLVAILMVELRYLGFGREMIEYYVNSSLYDYYIDQKSKKADAIRQGRSSMGRYLQDREVGIDLWWLWTGTPG